MTPEQQLDTVCVIGLGYIGLPAAAELAQAGNAVIGVDVNENTGQSIHEGTAPFVKEGLETAAAAVIAQGRLKAQTTTPPAEANIVSAPTPIKDDHEANLPDIKTAGRGLAPHLSSGELVARESTAPQGSIGVLARNILGMRPELPLEPFIANSAYFSHALERTPPSRRMPETAATDRTIARIPPKTAELNRRPHSTFCAGGLVTTNAQTADMPNSRLHHRTGGHNHTASRSRINQNYRTGETSREPPNKRQQIWCYSLQL